MNLGHSDCSSKAHRRSGRKTPSEFRNHTHSPRSGLTLLELMVVLVILAIVATVATPILATPGRQSAVSVSVAAFERDQFGRHRPDREIPG